MLHTGETNGHVQEAMACGAYQPFSAGRRTHLSPTPRGFSDDQEVLPACRLGCRPAGPGLAGPCRSRRHDHAHDRRGHAARLFGDTRHRRRRPQRHAARQHRRPRRCQRCDVGVLGRGQHQHPLQRPELHLLGHAGQQLPGRQRRPLRRHGRLGQPLQADRHQPALRHVRQRHPRRVQFGRQHHRADHRQRRRRRPGLPRLRQLPPRAMPRVPSASTTTCR